MVNPVSGNSSGTINSPYSGLMRVSGMASGMDIDGMVSGIMKAQRIPLDKLNQQKQTLQWQRDDYRSMNTSLNDLDTTIFDGISMQSTFSKKTVTSSDDSKVLATAVNTTNNFSARISVTNIATAASWQSTPISSYTGSAADLQFTVTDPGSTTTRTEKFSISSTDTLDNVIQKFNNSNLGVSMFQLSDKTIVMSNSKTGTGASIVAADANTQTFMNSLGFANSGTIPAKTNGNDAKIFFNGYPMTQKSNTFTISGVSYTIKDATDPTDNGLNPVNVSTATDVDSIYKSIKDFVDKYNDTIKTVNDKISEKRNRDYPPLTDDQRQGMTDSQITLWENKAKSGLLSNDSYLSSGLSSMRQDLYSTVTGSNVGQYTQLSQIGINTSSDYTENGKLVITETTLRQKIQEDPQGIYKLFNSTNSTGNTPYDSNGIANRLRDSISETTKQITAKAGSATYVDSQYMLGKQLTDISKQITDFQSKLSDMENRYYKQFSAMEQAMQQANQQAAYISQQFGSGG
jgi:flagellar hook-associated protein 2